MRPLSEVSNSVLIVMAKFVLMELLPELRSHDRRDEFI